MTFSLIPQVYAADWTTINSQCVSPEGVATIRGIECLFQNLIKPAPGLIALVAVGMLIIAGVRLMMAGADPKAYDAAWKTFTWAIIGVILLSVAWLVIILIKNFTGADITTFTVPS